MEENIKKKNGLILIGAAIAALVLVIVIVPMLIGIFNKGKKGAPVSYNVTLTKDGFEPKDIAVKEGDVVIWTNNSGKVASVNSTNQPDHQKFPFLNLGPFENGATLQTPFTKKGDFEYVNHLNPKDTGTVKVTQ